MTVESRKFAGLLLIILPTVIYGGVSILSFLINDPSYMENKLRQDLWRAGHAHAGVLLILSLVVLKYVDEANLPVSFKKFIRGAVPSSAIFLPVAFFFSVLKPDATEPNNMIYLAYVGAIILAVALFLLGVGLVRNKNSNSF